MAHQTGERYHMLTRPMITLTPRIGSGWDDGVVWHRSLVAAHDRVALAREARRLGALYVNPNRYGWPAKLRGIPFCDSWEPSSRPVGNGHQKGEAFAARDAFPVVELIDMSALRGLVYGRLMTEARRLDLLAEQEVFRVTAKLRGAELNTTEFQARGEADEVASGAAVGGGSTETKVKAVKGHVPGDRLLDLLGVQADDIPLVLVEDCAIAVLAEASGAFDGLWWADARIPGRASYPRGLAFSSKDWESRSVLDRWEPGFHDPGDPVRERTPNKAWKKRLAKIQVGGTIHRAPSIIVKTSRFWTVAEGAWEDCYHRGPTRTLLANRTHLVDDLRDPDHGPYDL